MKKNRQFWVIIGFCVLSILPFIPVAKSLVKIRSAMVFEQPISWVEGTEVKYQIPSLAEGKYELRMESEVSDWQPVVKLSWGLTEVQTSREIMSIPTPAEIILTRPIAKIHIQESTQGANELVVKFANSNTTKNALRIKLSHDRDALLAESSREFGIVLAISLALMMFLLRPFMATPKQ